MNRPTSAALAFVVAIGLGIAFGYVAWAVALSGLSGFGLLLAHRTVQRLGLTRICRVIGAWFWSSAFALETLQDRMQDARQEIDKLEAKRAEMEAA